MATLTFPNGADMTTNNRREFSFSTIEDSTVEPLEDLKLMIAMPPDSQLFEFPQGREAFVDIVDDDGEWHFCWLRSHVHRMW